MKIVYTGSFRFPYFDAAAARVLSIGKILRECGNEVFYVSFGGDEKPFKDGDKYKYQEFEFVNTHELDEGKDLSTLKRFYYWYSRGKKALRVISNLNGVDVIIGYNTPFWFSRHITNYCKINAIKYIEDRTEWYNANEYPGGYLLPFCWLNEYNMRMTIKYKVKNKIVISSYLDKYYKESNNIVIPPLTDIYDKKWLKKCDCTDSRILNHSGRRIIFAGNPAKKDLLANIIQGFYKAQTQIKSLQFLVIGVSESQSGIFVNSKVRQELGENLIFLGRIPQDDVPSYYGIADCSLIVRENDRKNKAGFPTKMAETMTAGCPVMLNETSDLGKFALDGFNAIVIHGFSAESIYEGLLRLHSMSEVDLKKLKQNAKQTGLNKFHWECYLQEVKSFLNSLI